MYSKNQWANNQPPAINADNLNHMEQGIYDAPLLAHPVGSLFFTTANVNPSTYFGGTWERYGNGRVLVGVDSTQTEFNAVGKTGGEKVHLLTANESGLRGHGHGFNNPTMPAHDHALTNSTYLGVIASREANSFSLHNVKSGQDSTYQFIGTTQATGFGVIRNTLGATSTPKTTGGYVEDATGQNAANAHNNLQPYICVYIWRRTA